MVKQKVDFGERLKIIRIKRGFTLLEVAERLGKTEATIQRYESGNIKNLKSDTIEELASFLRISPAYLMGWEQEDQPMFSSDYFYFPISIAAGIPVDVEAITDTNVQKITLPDTLMGKWAGTTDVVVMRVNGDSMNRVIPNNSLIAVKPVDFVQLKDNDIVVFSDENDYSVKRFFNDKENERFIFRPDSNDARFTDYILSYKESDNLKLHGKVVVYIVELD